MAELTPPSHLVGDQPSEIAGLVGLIRNSRRIFVFTGNGTSVMSGAPPETAGDHHRFLCSHQAREDYWERNLPRWDRLRGARPNAVHWAVLTLERQHRLELVATQNTDGLQLWVGSSPARVAELHGTYVELECQCCGTRADPAPHYEQFRIGRRLPACECGGYLRHAIVPPGQSPGEELARAASSATGADLVIAVGSTLDEFPSAALPLLAAQRGIPYVVINQGPTGQDDHRRVTLRLEGNPKEIFPEAVIAACGPITPF